MKAICHWCGRETHVIFVCAGCQQGHTLDNSPSWCSQECQAQEHRVVPTPVWDE